MPDDLALRSPPRCPAPDDTDVGLARRVAAGDAGAFERLMRMNGRMLFRTARAILHDDAEAEDCLQSAYLLAYRAMDGFAGQSKLSTWLVRIVVNEAIGRSRAIARRGIAIPRDEVGPDTLAAATPTADERSMRDELRRLIERRIDALPRPYRVVFVLRGVQEMSVGETATVLGIPEATVRTRYFRARALLREALRPALGERP